jgi:hypothetical protein
MDTGVCTDAGWDANLTHTAVSVLQVQRLESSEAAASAAAEAAQQQLREANRARLAAAAAAAETGSSSDVLAGRVAQLESQVEQCRDEARELSHQVDALQVCLCVCVWVVLCAGACGAGDLGGIWMHACALWPRSMCMVMYSRRYCSRNFGTS